ncbi:hypothetical protein C0Q70_18833 [Pomacea canaliculata]|uniref:Uncharacterized protein n=1 Tax=Pomacea canaliculata TaxID=400727 RepID=A0A2T7NHP1_POMCA|nr:hypothetical protein C0Q70_18833 [Pomacea canaliculata]
MPTGHDGQGLGTNKSRQYIGQGPGTRANELAQNAGQRRDWPDYWQAGAEADDYDNKLLFSALHLSHTEAVTSAQAKYKGDDTQALVNKYDACAAHRRGERDCTLNEMAQPISSQTGVIVSLGGLPSQGGHRPRNHGTANQRQVP